MTFNTKAVAQYLDTLAGGLSGVSGHQIGVPESISVKVYAFTTAGGQTIGKKTTGQVYRDARFNVTFAYRVSNAEATAETALMDVLDLFLAAIPADLTLGATCEASDVDTSLADSPEYIQRAGVEFREYPVIVTARQYDSFTAAH